MRKPIILLVIAIILLVVGSVVTPIGATPVFFFDTKQDSVTRIDGGVNDTVIYWYNDGTSDTLIQPDSTGGEASAESTFQVITATDHFIFSPITAPSETTFGVMYCDTTDSTVYLWNGVGWANITDTTGAGLTEDEVEAMIFDGDAQNVIGTWNFSTNPTWNALAIPNAALQTNVSLLGQTIGTTEIEDRAIDSSKVLWGSSGDSIDLDIIPDGQSYRKMTLAEGTKLSGIETGADVTDATNVETAGAIMDSDFGSSGIMKRTGAGTYGIITDNSGNWNTAYGWGNHSAQNYLDLDWVGNSDSLTEGSINLFEDLADNNIDELSNVKSLTEVYGDLFWFDTTGTDGWNRRAIGTAGQVLSIAGGVPDWGDYPDTLTIGTGGEVTAGATVSIEPAEISGGADGQFIRRTGGTPGWAGIGVGDLPSEVVLESELMDPDSIATDFIPDHADSNRDLGSSSKPWNDVYADSFHGDGSNLTALSEADTLFWKRESGHLYPRTSTDTLGTEAHPIPLGWFDAIEGTSSTAYIDLDSAKFNHLAVGNVSDAEFGYLDTVTSCIQGQLDGKVTQDTVVDSLIFYPEYSLIDSNSATGGVTIISEAELTNNTYRWYYHITSDSTALQRRDIHKVWQLPHDLISLDSVKGYYKTGVVGAGDNAFCLQLFKNGTGAAQTSDTTASTSWATKSLLSVGSWSAGQTAVFIGQCFVKSTENAYTRMSKIVAYYNRKKY